MSEDTSEMHYLNRAARNITFNLMGSDINLADNSIEKETQFANQFFKRMNQEIFASIDSKIFGHK